MKGNKGFSLVELIVVIAIMAVLTGVGIISVSMIGGFKATECAKNIVSLIDKVRIDTMGKNAAYLHVYADANGAIYTDYVTVINAGGGNTKLVTEAVGKKGVGVTYALESDTVNYLPLTTSGFYIQFDRSSGALKVPDVGGSYSRVTSIKVSQGNKTITITLYPETGKVVSETD